MPAPQPPDISNLSLADSTSGQPMSTRSLETGCICGMMEAGSKCCIWESCRSVCMSSARL